MSMFNDPQDEERLCQILRTYVEEWGAENVIVAVPEEWREYNTASLGQVRLEYGTNTSVSVRVEYESMRRLNYNVQLQAI